MMDSSLRVSVFVLAGSDAMLMSSDIGGHAVLLKLQDKNGCMEFDFPPPPPNTGRAVCLLLLEWRGACVGFPERSDANCFVSGEVCTERVK